MLPPANSELVDAQVINIPLAERWRIFHRLQELMIPCCCPTDGSLHVQISNLQTAILVRSILMQFFASREELIHWLEQCWQL
ncbi:Asr1405/Asl0597 family protein [Calothrix sp. UHCC 0171]|uniref:Asr1405/Asl0597 family protein n=1 Tax=Calothrix sp. UHCC 0171 TaxID=3110245 RepID=UPI002B2207FD|nr:Asr1405/Asl0597 family protein [Calothrix sp. UHCC 0171]MEA5569723.1 hypothetical protein [Calothrix sp. UHCC 0171]